MGGLLVHFPPAPPHMERLSLGKVERKGGRCGKGQGRGGQEGRWDGYFRKHQFIFLKEDHLSLDNPLKETHNFKIFNHCQGGSLHVRLTYNVGEIKEHIECESTPYSSQPWGFELQYYKRGDKICNKYERGRSFPNNATSQTKKNKIKVTISICRNKRSTLMILQICFEEWLNKKIRKQNIHWINYWDIYCSRRTFGDFKWWGCYVNICGTIEHFF